MALVLLHPVGLDRECWQFADIEDNIALDLPGHGKYDGEIVLPVSLEVIADDVCARIPGQFDILGLSMGGMVAMHVALRHPNRVRSMVLACTSAAPTAAVMLERARAVEAEGMEAVLAGTLVRWFSSRALADPNHAGVAYARSRLLAADSRAFALCWRAMAVHNVTDRLGNIHIPVTVIAGDADAASPAASLRAMADGLPLSRFEIVPGPHMLPLEEPRRFVDAVGRHQRWVAGSA